jgi:hypothetical protein
MELFKNILNKKALAISIVLEISLVVVSAIILISKPDHSSFFLAGLFHIPGSIIGFYIMEVLKTSFTSFYLPFTMGSIISILIQIYVFTFVISLYLKHKHNGSLFN